MEKSWKLGQPAEKNRHIAFVIVKGPFHPSFKYCSQFVKKKKKKKSNKTKKSKVDIVIT